MRIALTGVSGFIGSVIARHLHEAGHAVTGLVRETSRRDHVEAFVDRLVVGAQDDEGCWPELLDGAECVVHNSADWEALKSDHDRHLRSNVLGSLRLLRASAPRQFVFMSTVAVHHDMRPRERSEDGLGLIDEDHPLRPGTAYGAYKAAVEAHLWAEVYGRGRSCAAVRPCAVYGIDPNLERTIGLPIVKRIHEERRFDRPGGGKFVHVDDVAAVVARLAGADDAAGRVVNMADCYARWGDWASIAAELLGVEAEIDLSSPDHPGNVFDKRAANELGVALDRGRGGIREALGELIPAMRERGVIA